MTYPAAGDEVLDLWPRDKKTNPPLFNLEPDRFMPFFNTGLHNFITFTPKTIHYGMNIAIIKSAIERDSVGRAKMETNICPIADSAGLRLLLVDDDLKLLEITSSLLERKGYLVTSAAGSDEAIAILENDHRAFDIVVTDFCMPGLNGIELAGIIKGISADIPIILNTGEITMLDEIKKAPTGIARIILKPYRINDLDAMIREVIEENGNGRSSSDYFQIDNL